MSEYDEFSIENERKLDTHSRQKIELTRMVLNQSPNVTNDRNNLIDLFKIYSRVLSDISSPDFQTSISNSISIIELSPNKKVFSSDKLIDKLSRLKLGSNDSCIMLPIDSNGHMLSGVIRRSKNEYVFIVVNKGLRPDTMSSIEVFRVRESEISKLAKELEKSVDKPVNEIYKLFEDISYDRKTPKTQPSSQKGNNCYIKEPENAIKYAFGTSLSGEYVKWRGKTTEDIHRRFVEEIKKENPKISKELDKEFSVYLSNKFLNKAFKNKNNYYLNQNEIDKHLTNISLGNFKKYGKNVFNYLAQTGQVDRGGQLVSAAKLFSLSVEHSKDASKRFAEKDFSQIKEHLNELKKSFPLLNREFRMEFASMIGEKSIINMREVLKGFDKGEINYKELSKTERLFSMAMELNPNDLFTAKRHAKFLEGVADWKENYDILNPPKNSMFKNFYTRVFERNNTPSDIRQRAMNIYKDYPEIYQSKKDVSLDESIKKCQNTDSVEIKSTLKLSERRLIKEELIKKGQYKSNVSVEKDLKGEGAKIKENMNAKRKGSKLLKNEI